MSLTDRVRAAGIEESTRAQSHLVDELKRGVSGVLPPRRLAQLAAENPRQAESEIRSAAEAVIDKTPWLFEDARSASPVVEALVHEVLGLGPLEPLLADDSVTEIMVNGSKSLYVERSGVNELVPAMFPSDDAVRTLIDRIVGPLGRRVDEANPMVDARLASGHRVNAVIPPIALDGPILTIRKFPVRVLGLQDLVSLGSMDSRLARFLIWAVRLRKNLAVSGGTGSGKTTLLNALSCEIDAAERILTIEDSAELRFLSHPHVVRLEARPTNAEGKGEVSIRDLVRNALRMRPDRIIVGEVRGQEAIDMLSAMNTGHEGSLTTLHANSPADAVMRLSTMVRFAADLPIDVIEAQIGTALDLIVQVSRGRSGARYISHVCELSFDHEERRCKVDSLYLRERAADAGVWLAAPQWLSRGNQASFLVSEEVNAWLQDTGLLPSAA